MFLARNISSSLAISVIAAAVITGLLLAVTPWGLGLSPDSVKYLEAARHWYDHADLSEFSSHWPPLFPMLVGTVSHVTGDPALAGKLLVSSALFANVVLIGMLLARLTTLPAWAHAVALAAICLSAGFFEYHLVLVTEPLFVTLMLLNFHGLERMLRHPKPGPMAWAAMLGLITAAAIMLRYAGVFLLALNLVALVLISAMPLKIRLIQAAVTTAVASTPLALWLLYNSARGGGGTNRSIGWHPPADQHYAQLAETLNQWFNVPSALWMVAAALILIAAGVIGIRERCTIAGICGQALVVYSVLIFSSISLVDFQTPLDSRILAPVFVPAVFVLIHGLGPIARRSSLPAWTPAIAVAVLLATTLPGSYDTARQSHVNGLGFANRSLEELRIVQFAQQLPEGARIATNAPEILVTQLDRSGSMLPRFVDPNSGEWVSSYEQRMDGLAHNADVIIHFSFRTSRNYLPGPEQISEIDGFTLVYGQEDGFIWVTESYLENELRD